MLKYILISLLYLYTLPIDAKITSDDDIKQLQNALAREQRAIIALEQLREAEIKKINTLQTLLAHQISTAAKLSHAQTSPARLLKYHHYLAQARMVLIEDIQKAQNANDALIRKRLFHQAKLKKTLWMEMQKKPPPSTSMIDTSKGLSIYSIASGSVIFAEALRGFGLMVIINHPNGYMSLYGRNKYIYVKIGEKVKAGQLIASISNQQGDHLLKRYFELRHNGSPLPSTQNPFILKTSAR